VSKKHSDTVLCAWAEYANGPGWSNPIVWAIVRTPDGDLAQVAYQPAQQTDGMRALFSTSVAANEAMRKEAQSIQSAARKPAPPPAARKRKAQR